MHFNDVNKVVISAKQSVIKLFKSLNVWEKIVNVQSRLTLSENRVKFYVFIVFWIKKNNSK